MVEPTRGMLDEARECIEAAEALGARARVFGPVCGPARLAALWQECDWNVERAGSLLEEVKRQIGATEVYLARKARIALIAAPRP